MDLEHTGKSVINLEGSQKFLKTVSSQLNCFSVELGSSVYWADLRRTGENTSSMSWEVTESFRLWSSFFYIRLPPPWSNPCCNIRVLA